MIVRDTFEYKGEMLVLALQCRVEVGISCTEKGREFVATSIVVLAGMKMKQIMEKSFISYRVMKDFSIICFILMPAQNHDAGCNKLPTLFGTRNTNLHCTM